MTTRTYTGGCHCGAVRFEVEAPAERLDVLTCTCSICAITGFVHLIVPESKMTISQGLEQMTTYRFNTGVARHLFCPTCGVKPFYRPRSNPDGWSVNLRCLEVPADVQITTDQFDGANWEAHAAALAHLSREDA